MQLSLRRRLLVHGENCASTVAQFIPKKALLHLHGIYIEDPSPVTGIITTDSDGCIKVFINSS